MAITTRSSREFNQDTSRAKQAASKGPVFITARGQPAHVLLTIDDYQKLAGCHTSIGDQLSMPGWKTSNLIHPDSVVAHRGGCGLFALLSVVQALYAQRQTLAYHRNAVLVMMIAGWVTLLAIGVFGSTDAEHAGSRLLFFWLPLLSSVHILFLARRLLFGTPKPMGPA